VDPGFDPPPSNRQIAELDALLDEPARWAEIEPDTLRHLLFYQCLSYGIQPDESVIQSLMSLQRVAVERLAPAVRRQVAVHLARAVERVHREHGLDQGAGCTNALLPFLLEDPDPSVVSAAATELALLLPLEDGEILTGPRYVSSLVGEAAGEDARAGLVAGLLQIGDARLGPLVASAWKGLGEAGRQTLALLIQSFHGASRLVVEFLLDWLEDESSAPGSPGFGVVAATLARAGRHAAEHGVSDVRRVFPLTVAPEGAPFEETRELSVGDLLPGLRERLLRVASAERPPHLMAHVVSYWELDEDAYHLAVEIGVATAEPTAAGSTERPVSLELSPGWPDDPAGETLLEWGILNPIGPTINTLRLTPVADRAALVYTLYHPTRTTSRIMALLEPGADAASLAGAFGRVMAQNGSSGVWLVRSLPDYVHRPESSPIALVEAAAAMAAARAVALRAGEETTPLAAHAERLRRLAADPWGVTAAELDQARRGGARTAPANLPEGPEDYSAWLDVAAASAHVAAIRPLLPQAWRRLMDEEESGAAG
jgi:hypothetical protein